MAFATVNGIEVVEGRLSLPRSGVWHGAFMLDALDLPAGRIELVIGGQRFLGSARRSGNSQYGWLVQVVAGAGGLSKEVRAKSYSNVPLRIPLQDILTTAGERLAPNVAPELLSRTLASWSMVRAPGATALEHLLLTVPATWRMLPGGSLWLGVESWPENDFAYELLEEDPLHDRCTILCEQPSVLPGQTFRRRRVSYVDHMLEPEQFRTVVWFE